MVFHSGPAIRPSTLLACVAVLATSSAGCFKASDDDDEVGDTGETATDTGATDTDTTTTTDTSDGPMPIPPTIDVFTVAGSETPAPVMAASGVMVVVEASDADGQIDKVELLRNGVVFATIPAPGPYSAEFLVGGEAFDGVYEFTARAVDDDGLEGTAGPIELSIDVPNGGVVETWTFDGGGDDFVYRVWANPEGTEVVAAGSATIDGMTLLKADRLVGDNWTTDIGTNPQPASGIVGLPTGDFAAVSWNGTASVRYRYDSTGLQTAEEIADWSPPNVPIENFEAPLDLATDEDGNFYATGIFATGQNYDTFMLRKFMVDGSEDWNVYGSNPMTYPIPPYAVRLDVGGDTVAAAGQLRQNVDPIVNRPWMGVFGTNGGLVGQVDIVDFDGTAWAVGVGDQGDIMLGGSRFGDPATTAWVARYDAALTQLWIKEEPLPGIAATIAADIDGFGDSVVVTVSDCDGGLIATTGCDMQVRKYDPEGTLVWEQLFEDDLFTGPALVPIGGDIHLDRYGYAYVAITHGNMATADWWVTKFNP